LDRSQECPALMDIGPVRRGYGINTSMKPALLTATEEEQIAREREREKKEKRRSSYRKRKKEYIYIYLSNNHKCLPHYIMFNLLDQHTRALIYQRLDLKSLTNLVTSINDRDCIYAIELAMRQEITADDMICLDFDHQTHLRLFEECPIITQLPKLYNMIIAGGFVNLACDMTLNYRDYPQSDIDLFVCGGKDHVDQLINWFEQRGATFQSHQSVCPGCDTIILRAHVLLVHFSPCVSRISR
jgi:hypothetical protein